MFVLQVLSFCIWLPLEILIMAALLRGGWRRFPLIFLYILVDFLVTASEIRPALAYWRVVSSGVQGKAPIWWDTRLLLETAVYAAVISLIYGASAKLGPRRVMRLSVITGAVLFAGVSFLVHYSPSLPTRDWMTPWMRDVHFCSAVLDLILWALLIRRPHLDRLLLLLSGGLGIKFAGEAIGESLRLIGFGSHSAPFQYAGSILFVMANWIFLYIWWQALRTATAQAARNLRA